MQKNNEIQTSNMNDDVVLKTQSEIEDAVDDYRDSQGILFDLISTLFVIGMVVTAGVTIVNANDNNQMVTGIAASSVMALGAIITHRHKLEKETKFIEETAMCTVPKVFGDTTNSEFLKKGFKDSFLFGQAVPAIILGESIRTANPAVALLGGALLVGCEVGKHIVSKSQRKDLEQKLGSYMPTLYRMYKQNTR